MLLKKNGLTRAGIATDTGLSIRSVYAAVKGEPVSLETAKAISAAVGLKLEKAFSIQEKSRALSAKTVIEHHCLISTVLDQAEKEGLVPFNVASKATLPKAQKKEVNYEEADQRNADILADVFLKKA